MPESVTDDCGRRDISLSITFTRGGRRYEVGINVIGIEDIVARQSRLLPHVRKALEVEYEQRVHGTSEEVSYHVSAVFLIVFYMNAVLELGGFAYI